MLSRQLARIPWNHPNGNYHEMEAFAATYWASYNADSVLARTVTSMQRAWDFDDYAMVPRVNGGKPGYVILKWNGGGVSKVVVGIEGMTSNAQLWAAFVGANGLTVSPLQGRVYHSFKTYGDAILAEVLASPLVVNAFAHSPTAITFSGFSMGAAIAEYMSAKFKNGQALIPSRLVKFGAPRTGSTLWRDGNALADTSTNIYLRTDPIHNFPYITQAQLESLLLPYNDAFVCYANNDPCQRMNEDGGLFSFVEPTTYGDYVTACLDRYSALALPNPWVYHDRNQYRRAMCSRAVNAGGDVEQRFRYLEFINGDFFGTNFATNFDSLDFLMSSQHGTPPDFVPPVDQLTQELLQRANQRPQDVVVRDPLTTPRPLPAPVGNPGWRPRTTRNF